MSRLVRSKIKDQRSPCRSDHGGGAAVRPAAGCGCGAIEGTVVRVLYDRSVRLNVE